MLNTEVILFDGKFVHAAEPLVGSSSRGLMYGEGVFETFRTYGGHTLLLNDHLQRLQSGLDLLGMQLPKTVSLENFRPLLYRLLDRLDLLDDDAVVRLQLWREGGRGYLPDSELETHFMVTASPCPKAFDHPQLATVDCKRIPNDALPSRHKFSNGINYILAARQADQQGADDALMETVNGFLSETTIANIFWAQGKQVFTPAGNCDLLPGITRQIIIDIIYQKPEWTLVQGTFEKSALREADVVWICNSVREILTVRAVDQMEYSTDHPIFHEVQRLFREFKEKHLQSLNTVQ